MLQRIISIICIVLLLGVSGLPFISWSGNPDFVYASEELTQDETLEAGIAAYLNQRGGYIASTSAEPVETVQAVMKSWINTYEYWKNTNVGSLAEVYANIIIRYNPFRVSLKGPAVRAFNDLYDWLVSTGKLNNLQAENSGADTTDNLYTGLNYSGTNFYVVNGSPGTGQILKNVSDVQMGNPVNGITGESLIDYVCSQNNVTVSDISSDRTNSDIGLPDNTAYNFNYFADVSYTLYLKRWRVTGSTTINNYKPSVYCNNGISTSNTTDVQSVTCKSYGVKKIIGNPAYILFKNNASQYLYCGFVGLNYTDNTIAIFKAIEINRNDRPGIVDTSAKFDTSNFNKTNPTPPEDDGEVTYTPQVKETSGNYNAGDTFNTYNEYITNYVNKNTVINNNYTEQEPETPGGTTPPWDNSDTAGTLTPNGNGYDLSLPDLTLPDLDIDWSINGLKDKFPFSIPWDLMAFFTVLNAEPETPEIQGTIDLGIVDWEIDWSLEQFDTLAALLRNLEFIGFCIGLILITRHIIKG